MNKAIIICGAPGAGKSTYGKSLASKTGAALIDIDTCTERIVKVGLKLGSNDINDRDSKFFKENYREAIYEQMFDIAKENLANIDVVIVGPFTKELKNKDWPKLLKNRLGSPVEIHYVCCSANKRKERIKLRGELRDITKLNDWEEHLKNFNEDKVPPFKHILFENDTDINL